VRQAFAHEAVLMMEPDADVRVPGAAVTVALCGHWNHEPPCPLAPHRVNADRVGGEVRVRVLFATEPAKEPEVRHRIEQALSGQVPLPDGMPIRWQLRASSPSNVSAAETEQAEHLVRS
jgi:hypothetical protein